MSVVVVDAEPLDSMVLVTRGLLIFWHGGFAGSGRTHAGVGCGVVRCCDGSVLIESRQHPNVSISRVVSKILFEDNPFTCAVDAKSHSASVVVRLYMHS